VPLRRTDIAVLCFVVALALTAGVRAAIVGTGGGQDAAPPRPVLLETDGGLAPAVALVDGGPTAVASAAAAPHPATVALSSTGRTWSFEDPNGGSWRVVEFSAAGWTYWAVAVGQTRHEPTLRVPYNAAFLIDGGLVGGGAVTFRTLPVPLEALA